MVLRKDRLRLNELSRIMPLSVVRWMERTRSASQLRTKFTTMQHQEDEVESQSLWSTLARTSSSGYTTNAVQVVDRVRGELVLHAEGDLRKVESARGNVRAHQTLCCLLGGVSFALNNSE